MSERNLFHKIMGARYKHNGKQIYKKGKQQNNLYCIMNLRKIFFTRDLPLIRKQYKLLKKFIYLYRKIIKFFFMPGRTALYK